MKREKQQEEKFGKKIHAMNVDSLVESFNGIVQELNDNHVLFKVGEETRELYPEEIRNVKWVGNTNYEHESMSQKANVEFEKVKKYLH
ncbi:hypothetical protein [Paucilactobacillus sp. N302-9]